MLLWTKENRSVKSREITSNVASFNYHLGNPAAVDSVVDLGGSSARENECEPEMAGDFSGSDAADFSGIYLGDSSAARCGNDADSRNNLFSRPALGLDFPAVSRDSIDARLGAMVDLPAVIES